MIRERVREFTSLVVIADIMLMTSGYLIASVLFPLHLFSTEHYLLVMTSIWAIIISMTLFCLYLNHAYESARAKSLSKIFSETLLATIQAFCVVVALLFIYKLKDVSRGFMLVYFASFFLLVLSRRVFQAQFLRMIRRNGHNYISILVIGSNKTARRFIMMVDLYKDLGFKVIGLLSNEQHTQKPKINPNIPVIGTFNDLDAILKKNVVDRVVFACRDDELPFSELKSYLQICEEYGVPTTMVSRFANTRYHNVTLENLGRTEPGYLRSEEHAALFQAGQAGLGFGGISDSRHCFNACHGGNSHRDQARFPRPCFLQTKAIRAEWQGVQCT